MYICKYLNEKFGFNGFLVFVLILTLMLGSIEIQKLIKDSFSNGLKRKKQKFDSPCNIIILVSAFSWLFSYLIRLLLYIDFSQLFKIQQDLGTLGQHEQFSETDKIQCLQNNISQNKKLSKNQIKQWEFHKNQTYNRSILDILKTVIPNFLSIYLFIESVRYLSFTQAMIFKIVSKLGLTYLYDALIDEQPHSKKYTKLIISIFTFLGFTIFNYSTPLQINQSHLQKSSIKGYIFVISMSYITTMKYILNKKVQNQQQKIPYLDRLTFQCKGNFICAYILGFIFNQEVHGVVFSWFHPTFFTDAIVIGVLLFLSILIKKILQDNLLYQVTDLAQLFQKNISLMVSLVFLNNLKINYGQIVGIAIILLMGILNYKYVPVLLRSKQENNIKINNHLMTDLIYNLDEDEHIKLKK